MNKHLIIQNDEIPVLGLGTYGLNGKQCVNTVSDALGMGYRHLDTAQMYGNEEAVGKGIIQSGIKREEVFVTTKVSTRNLNADGIMSSTETSLLKLKTGYIDLLLIHWPVPGMDLYECLSCMFLLRNKGNVRHVGVSNFNPDLFRKALELGPVFCNQVEFSPYHMEKQNLEIAKEAGVMITAYSPLGKGRIGSDSTLKEIAESYRKTPAQVALRWLIQQGPVSVIPKASSREHLEENIQLFDFELSDDHMSLLSR